MLSWCCLQVAVASTGTVFSPSFLVYCGLRFLSAFGLAGIILTLSTLSESLGGASLGAGEGTPSPVRLRPLPAVEWTTTPRRAVSMTMLGCTFSAGQMALAGLAFALRDWRDLQLTVSVPFFAISLTSWSVQGGASSWGAWGAGVPPSHRPGWLWSRPVGSH